MGKHLSEIVDRTIEINRIKGIRLGMIVQVDINENKIWVDFENNPYPNPVLAKLGSPWICGDELIMFKHKAESVKLEFENGDPAKPVIRDLYFSINEMNRADSKSLKDKVLKIDAEEIVLEAQKQLTIKCGEATMVFESDGSKIVQKADDIESKSQNNTKISSSNIHLN